MIWATKDSEVWYLVGKDFESDAREYDGIREQMLAVFGGLA